MEGQINIPFVEDAALINIPHSEFEVTIFIDSTNGHLRAKKHDNTLLTAGTLAGGVVVPLVFA